MMFITSASLSHFRGRKGTVDICAVTNIEKMEILRALLQNAQNADESQEVFEVRKELFECLTRTIASLK